jgi:hypothetical protein
MSISTLSMCSSCATRPISYSDSNTRILFGHPAFSQTLPAFLCLIKRHVMKTCGHYWIATFMVESRSRTERTVGRKKIISLLPRMEPWPLNPTARREVTSVTELYRLPFEKHSRYSLGLYSLHTELQCETVSREWMGGYKVNVRCGGIASVGQHILASTLQKQFRQNLRLKN